MLYAEDQHSPRHDAVRTWRDAELSGMSPVCLCWTVLGAFIKHDMFMEGRDGGPRLLPLAEREGGQASPSVISSQLLSEGEGTYRRAFARRRPSLHS
jgi:hypothetical protein